ncbi:hypothetical protein GGF31_003895 [Allomyces arbusculus]|nr:hypothetical protein GGF31_003895 [Allomyces arbusculus]
MPPTTVRVGCYSAFWGDSVAAASQLVRTARSVPALDFVVADYLAEVTMGVLAKRVDKGGSGYVDEFVRHVLGPLLPDIVKRNIRIVTNAGGLDPRGLKSAIEKAARDAGFTHLIVAAVHGDNLLDPRRQCARDKRGEGEPAQIDLLPMSPTNDGQYADAIPPVGEFVALNAYLGAQPVAHALDQGAHIVVTGRVVDSALVLGPLLHAFKWAPTDWDQLAAGSLAGHLLECGCHATGGNFTDWRSVAGGWSHMGYPIAEIQADGVCTLTKLPGTGGAVTPLTVGEQFLYEVLDPRAYLLPDVTVDVTNVTLSQVGPDRVEVRGARGRPPTPYLKVSGIVLGDYTLAAELLIAGVEAKAKAIATAEAIRDRVAVLLPRLGVAEPFREFRIECLGSETLLGPHARVVPAVREVVLRIHAAHEDKRALGVLGMEIAPAATCMAPGITGAGSGRPRPTRQLRHISALVPKPMVWGVVDIGTADPHIVPFSSSIPVIEEQYRPDPITAHFVTDMSHPTDLVNVPLIHLAVARSGDKGDACNIGVMARDARYYPHLIRHLTAERVHDHMRHLVDGRVDRYLLPGSHSLNFVLTKALGGGGLASLRIDRQGKTYAQVLLATMTVPVPRGWNLPTTWPGDVPDSKL